MSSIYANANINYVPNVIPSYSCGFLWISSSKVSIMVLNKATDKGFPCIIPSCITYLD